MAADNPELPEKGESSLPESPGEPSAMPMNGPREDYLIRVENLTELVQGMVVRRVGSGKIQQGGFVKLTDDGQGMILLNVIDLIAGEFAAEAGVIKPEPGDEIYRHPPRGENVTLQEKARQVLSNWALFSKHPELKNEMLEFMEVAFSAEHVLYMKRNEMLPFLFVPLQERFKIGKHEEKVDWEKVRDERFAQKITELTEGKHITYVAFIPTDTTHQPMFYSIGTKPHIETMKNLEREPFAFKPNRGGHIKIVSPVGEPRKYVVDAGSNDLGRGMHTSRAVAETITLALQEYFPDFEFIPLPGRDAYGLQQSW